MRKVRFDRYRNQVQMQNAVRSYQADGYVIISEQYWTTVLRHRTTGTQVIVTWRP